MNAFRVHVLTSCTGSKVSTRRPAPAERLYRGQQHVRLMAGVDEARGAGVDVRLSIVSAGHGLMDGETEVRRYEQTFQGRSAEARRGLAADLGIPEAVDRVLKKPVDLHLCLLGEDYLDACQLSDEVAPSAPVVVVCGAQATLRIPPVPKVHTWPLRTEDTRRFGCGLVGLKGEIGKRLLRYIAAHRPVAHELTGPGVLDEIAASDRSGAVASTLF